MLKPLTGWRWPLLAGAATFGVFLWSTQAPVPHADTVRDFLYARDCWELGVCHSRGASTSFGHLSQGGSWIHLLVVFHLLGVSAQAIQICIVAVQAVAVTIFAAVTERLFSAPASYAATFAYAYALSQIDDAYILWNPSTLALFVLLASTGCLLGARTGRPLPLLLASVMVGFGSSRPRTSQSSSLVRVCLRAPSRSR
jgi:hypothetical protein